jgi:hypothetical protein
MNQRKIVLALLEGSYKCPSEDINERESKRGMHHFDSKKRKIKEEKMYGASMIAIGIQFLCGKKVSTLITHPFIPHYTTFCPGKASAYLRSFFAFSWHEQPESLLTRRRPFDAG